MSGLSSTLDLMSNSPVPGIPLKAICEQKLTVYQKHFSNHAVILVSLSFSTSDIVTKKIASTTLQEV